MCVITSLGLSFLPAVFLLASAVPLAADDFQWFVGPDGDGISFADDGNWFNFDKIPHNPSGPPGTGDSADLISGATVVVSSAGVKTLTGAGTAMFTVNGTFTAQTVATRLTLAGNGTLTGTNVTSAPVVVGGHLTAQTFTDTAISVSESGSMTIAGAVSGQFGSTVNVFVDSNGTLSIGGAATNLSGAVQGGAHATIPSLSNSDTGGNTLDIGGAGTTLDIAGACTISDGSLDINSGAATTVGGQFTLLGNADFSSITSSWQGSGTTVTASGLFLVGGDEGSYTVEIADKAHGQMNGGAAIAPATAAGDVSVSDAGTSWSVFGSLAVGAGGTGSLSITDGGLVSLFAQDSLFTVGNGSGSTGSVMIHGTGASFVGYGGGSLGVKAGSTGTVSLTNTGTFQIDAGSDESNVNSFIIGEGGSGHFTVGDTCFLTLFGSTPRTFIGKNAGSDGDLLVNAVTGAGAYLGIATVGGAGIGQAAVSGTGGNASSLTLLLGDALTGSGTVTIYGGGGWTNQEGVYVGGLSLVQNAGIGQLTVQDNSILRTADLFVSKTGTVTVTTPGTVGVGTGALGPGGSVRVSESGFLLGAGDVQGKVIVGSGGRISPESAGSPGLLTVTGDFEQDAGGTYSAEIGGTAAGTGFDQINVTGAASLGGNLNVRFVKGFTPVDGQTFRVLKAASRSGQFATISAPAQAGISVSYDAAGAIVTITSVETGTPVISSPTMATAGPGQPFSYQIVATNLLGTSSVSQLPAKSESAVFSASNLPSGLTIDSSSGLISGTPTGIGLFIVPISASNAAGTGQADLILLIDPIFGGLLQPPSNLLNISTRLNVQAGDNVLIGGFIITGNDPKKVLVRGIGPSLGTFGVLNPLSNPTLELHNPDGSVVTNDNWSDTQQSEISASGLAPTNDLESAIIATLEPGTYTAILSGKNGGTGVGLVEAYDLDQAVDSQLGNISTRGFVQAGDNVMIGGLIVAGGGEGNSTVVVRAIGPSLGAFGVANPLQDPTLELHDGSGAIVAFDDNWQDLQEAEITADQLAPSDDRESAIEATLSPGAYTAIVRGAGDTTGVGLVEAYNIR